MSDIKFNCPQCGQHLAVDAPGAGLTVACPKCGQSIIVPSVAVPQAVATPNSPPKIRWWLWSLAGAIIITVALAAVWFVAMRRPPTAATPFLKTYFAAKEQQSRALAKKLKLNVVPEVWAYFDAGARGDWQMASNLWSNLRQRSGQYSGHGDSSLDNPVWQPVIETVMARDLFEAWGSKYATRFGNDIIKSIPPGSIYFGGTDPGRGLVTALCKSAADGQPIFVLTQNALLDPHYRLYLQAIYGDKIHVPTDEESEKAFQDYQADAQRRLEHDANFPNEPKQVRPGEDVHMENGRVKVQGEIAVWSIAGQQAKLIFDKNPDREFFVEESFPLEWMRPYFSPHGLVMKVNRKPLGSIPPEEVKQDQKFWSRELADKVGDWLTEDTPVSNVCAFAEKVFFHQDYSGFSGDREFVGRRNAPGNYYARSAYAHLRNSIAGVYFWRAQEAKDPAERERMKHAADFAFRQALALDPSSPETVFNYGQLLSWKRERLDDALLIAKTARDCAPDYAGFADLIAQLENEKQKAGVTPSAITNSPPTQSAQLIQAATNIEVYALHKAAYEGNLEEVKALIAKGADVNARWPKDNNFTPLLFAVTKGHENLRGIFDTSGFKKINELKDRTKNVNYPRQYAEIVSLLLANGADINANAPRGETPLLVSLQFDCSDMAQLLIAKGADVNAKDNQGTTPLFSAALGNDKGMENLLMAKGAKVDIFTASAMGDIERVQGFLNSNPSMINATQGVLTPFHVAAYSGQTEMMKFLLGKGVDVNAGYPEKITPLFLAANNGHLDAAELLIAKGAIINSESSNSQSPLFGAAWGGNKAIGELLIAKGADVNAKNDIGWTPLFAAAMTSKGSNDMVELLIAKGADVNAKDKDGRTPLWAAVDRNHLERARLLVSKGADINAKYKDGLTALDIAARFAYKDFVEFLIANGADVHMTQDAGWTPLHYAAYGGNKDIVEMLLAKVADANAKDKDGKTPPTVARDEGYTDVAELIRKYQDKNKLKEPAANEISSSNNITFKSVAVQTQPVAVTVAADGSDADLPPRFLGLSYEMSMLRPNHGRYYFDPNDQALVNTFRTLGIKSLRVGAAAVDRHIPMPQEKDIDVFFNFARAAGVKVIYSFRLKDGNPADSARMAGYIAAHDADALDCFAIGNEPSFYLQTFEAFFAQWKLHYDAILKAVPNAMFDGPSVAGDNFYALNLAKAVFAGGHLAMASDHYYFLGWGREGEKDPPATRARFLSNGVHRSYQEAYAHIGAVLAAQGVPYRIDEMNSCYNGGAKDSSDTYASTLWALDCTHWWAAHHILGVNYHTGESVDRDGGFGATNFAYYAAFAHQVDGHVTMQPQAYAYLAFSQGAHGRPLGVKIQAAPTFNFNAYAYRDRDGSIYLTLINKSFGDNGQPASVSLQLPQSTGSGAWQRMDLAQKDQDVAAKTGVMLGGASIDPQGIWSGQWKKIEGGNSGNVMVQVAPASATILKVLEK
jgi:cytohesin